MAYKIASVQFTAKLTHLGGVDTDPFVNRIIGGLAAADLYWVSPEFTHLAAASAQQLPDLSLTPEELPSRNGLLVWAAPISQVLSADTAVAPEIIATSWTVVPQGVWVVAHARPEQFVTPEHRDAARETCGWLMPFSSGGAIKFGEITSEDVAAMTFVRGLLATWFLLAQPGVATEDRASVDPKIRKAYKRTGRAEPHVKVINLRRQRHSAEHDDRLDPGPKRQLTVRFMVRGHWKRQAYGPARSLRKTIYVAPFLKGPDDAPLKTVSRP
jgi:hypothetical protein